MTETPGQHIHALLPSGAEILEELFPGLLADLVSGGTPVVSDFSRGAGILWRPSDVRPGSARAGRFRAAEPAISGAARPHPGQGAAQRGDHRRMRGRPPG